MSITKGLRLLRAAALGNVTTAELQAYLGIEENRAGFQKALRLPGRYAGVADSVTAATIFASSPLAMADICAAASSSSGGLLAAFLNSAASQATILNSAIAFGAILGSATGLTALYANTPLLATLVSSAGYMATIAANPSVFVNDATCASAACASNTALAALFASSAAKGAIAVSENFMARLVASANAKTWLTTNKQVTKSTPGEDGVVGAFVPFGPTFPSKILIIAAKMNGNNLGAIPLIYSGRLVGGNGSSSNTVISGATLIISNMTNSGTMQIWGTFENCAFDIGSTGYGGVNASQNVTYVDMT